MPNETQAAVDWAKQQQVEVMPGYFLTVAGDPVMIVDKVREYFNAHEIPYESFSYDDLVAGGFFS